MSIDSTAALLSGEQPGATDLSQEVLATIFGSGWWDLTTDGPAQSLFTLLGTLNAICAVVIAWLLILTLIITSTGAAQEGRVFGGHGRSPWVPLRFAFAIAAVAPVHHGLCVMQILLLSCVGVSINMANSMLESALNWFETNGTLVARQNASLQSNYAHLKGTLDVSESITGASRMGGKTLAVQILQTEAFLTYLHTQLGCDTPVSNFADHLTQEVDPKTQDVTLLFSSDGTLSCERGMVHKNREVFGGFRLHKNAPNDAIIPLAMDERIRLLKDLITRVEKTKAPEHFARMEMSRANNEPITVFQDREKVQAEGEIYATTLSTLVRGQGTRSEELSQKLALFLNNAKHLGWFALGSHYWSLATLEQELVACDDVTVSWIEPRFRSFADILPISFATTFWPRINEASYVGDTPSASLWEKLLEYLAPFTGLSKRFAMHFESEPDCLLAMVRLARWVSGTCTTILVASEAAKLAAIGGSKLLTKNAASRVADFFTGGGEAGDAVSKALIHDLSFFLLLILLPLWVLATFIAYLVPAIPFLIWIAAIAGWVVLTLEAVIAAPLWLIGHAMPEGEGFAGQHGRSGYLLVLSVLLRPCLLVLSMLVCFMVMRATGSIVGTLCAPFIDVQPELGSITLGIVGSLFLFLILCAATTLLTWKLFELVTQMPDRIIRWLGQQIANLGNEAATAMSMKLFRQAETQSQTLAYGALNISNTQTQALKNAATAPSKESGYLQMEPLILSQSTNRAEDTSKKSTQPSRLA